MKKVTLIFVFLLLWLPLANAKSIITIEIQEDGDALWNIEQRLHLESPEEIKEWEYLIKKGYDPEQYNEDITNFRDRIEWFINSAEKYTNRSMNARNFNISYDLSKTLSGDFGIVLYTFEWNNFSRVQSGNIIIGDTFSDGMLLSADNVLIIEIPQSYEITSTSPEFDKRDGNRLIWDGTLYRSFGKGEPALVISRNPTQGTWYFIIVFIGLSVASSVIYLKKWHLSGNKKEKSLNSPNSFYMEDLQYEEMIEQIIIQSGGQVPQSFIVEKSGFSKSKISVVITEMKQKGRIVKIRNGKENLIRLVNK